jgi:tRNA A-37 threonylcarbamoyl transferase component Bud32
MLERWVRVQNLVSLNSQIVDFCRRIAGSGQLTAIGLVDNSSETLGTNQLREALVVIKNFQPKIMSYFNNFNDSTVFFLVVDQRIFESDVRRGLLGEAFAGKLVFPYSALLGKEYLDGKEIALKRRLVLELLENLALNYPELIYHMKIKPQYFLYEVMFNRLRVFPLLSYEFSGYLKSVRLRNESEAAAVYEKVLHNLSLEGTLKVSDGYVTVSKEFIVKVQKSKGSLRSISKNAQRRVFASFFESFPQLLNRFHQNATVFLRTQRVNWRGLLQEPYFVDSNAFLFVPTSGGLVSLADKMNIREYVEKLFFKDGPVKCDIKSLGGVLNDVYLISAQVSGVEKRVLVKRFKEWSGFKWFPLNMWSRGARSFAVSAQSRLAKECATSEFLLEHGFKVPRIYQISNSERLVFMEFVKGEDLSVAIKRLATAKTASEAACELARLELAGELMAKVHETNMSLGDSKPENMIYDADGSIYLLDFEQAALGGDKVWDIAEFLYYSGHFLSPLNSNGKTEVLAQAFIDGYLRGGGNAEDIRKAADSKYRRVFSIFTMPSIITQIAFVCEKTGKKPVEAEEKKKHN